MSAIRIGLIGTGRIGQVHAESIEGLSEATLSRVADTDTRSAEATAEKFGASVSTPDDIFRSDDVDAVLIASPTSTHLDLMMASVEAGIPALCEKPIDLDITRVDAVREVINSSGVPVAIGFNRRFDPHFQDFRRRVLSGEIGALEQLLITSRDPAPAGTDYLAVSGGIFRDMTIHDFDMARFILGDIVEVSAQGYNQFSEDIKGLGDFDATSIALRSASDQFATITNSRHAAHGFDQRMEALGSEGMVRVENVSDTEVRTYTAEAVESKQPYKNFFLERYLDAFRLELLEFVKLVRGEPGQCPTFDDGRMALMLANAATESAQTGRVVRVEA
ncbi:inositol 2-dehydrogenase [Pontimonas sp.]|uniref:inositol 2-dehydrogenase n=1 Tax=Pontimonas sp. TaxID=2304492 RepID=UPI0028701D1C|nr:inositol 2-dehydrogenase [Pontimonas sp.]MDR9396604.1 inositol 2-dehydrogenase [Pontimonas sp.]MDR9434913.1 inositol 2-dehydrogenase [Pontimonas sp.]